MMTPRILLLDDAFSHLDEETESEIIGNLLEALPQTTIVFTSHRISSLRRADRVVVLGDGRLLQEGDPLSLVETSGYFRRIWQEQHLLRELERVDGEGKG
jgi:ABC-type multidrug transport system fused ATPase/permease subunit